MKRPPLLPLCAAIAALVALAWIGGALYLVWAGLDPGRANPLTLWRYWRAYGARPGEADRLAISALLPLAGVLGVIVVAATAPARYIHGRSRWGNWFDLKRLKLDAPRGLILGEAFGGFVRCGGEAHVLVVAPTGAGKTTGIVIPNLLSWTGSVVTLDPKREAWTATAGSRAKYGEVFLWAPLDAEGRTCRFNPLDQIASDKVRRVIDLMKLAAALIPEPENETRWIAQSAQRLFRALALWVVDTPGTPNSIGEIWRIVTTPDDLQAWCHRQAIDRTDLDLACVADLAAFSGAVDKERAYILNELQNALQPWSSAAVRAATSASDFRLADLRRRRMAVYLAIDPADTGAYGRLFRIFFEMTADALMRAEGSAGPNSTASATVAHEVLLLIDEFATFGRLPLIEKLMAAVRGYRARIMIVCQALSQLDNIYGVAGRNALLGNATRHIFMPNPDPATGAYVSQRIGDTTMAARTRSQSSGGAHGRNSTSLAQVVRTFLKPEEFERLPPGVAVLLAPGAAPLRIRIRGWFECALFRKRVVAAPHVSPLPTEPPVVSYRVERRAVRKHGKEKSATVVKVATTSQGELFSGPLPAKEPIRHAGSDAGRVQVRGQSRPETPPSWPAQVIKDVDHLDATDKAHQSDM